MSTYDLKRLEVAIQYIRRMSEGKNPVSNRPAPENEVLNNVNVHRCLKFIDEVLTDVHKSGGSVGLHAQKERKPKEPVSQTFPYEILDRYEYVQDQQISYLLRQLEEYLPEGSKMPVPATLITTWLRENGYLEIKAVNDTGRENSVPTTKGEDLGIYDERAGVYPNEYYRVFYNENAQRFIIQNFRKILTEAEAIRERNRKERKSSSSPAGRSRSSSENQHMSPAPAPASSGASRPAPSAPGNEGYREELPQEYYDMLSQGWQAADDDVPW